MKFIKVYVVVGLVSVCTLVQGSNIDKYLNLDLLSYQETETSSLKELQINAINQQVIDDLYATPVDRLVRTTKGYRLNGLTKAWVDQVVESINRHPVVGYYQREKYNRENVSIGFCFGRATYTHLALLKMGVNKDAIRKAWVVGTMKAGNIKWAFHVTTLVKDYSTNKWWAVDSVPGQVLELKDWYAHFKKQDQKANLRLYVSSPNKFSVSLGEYSRVQMGLDLTREQDWYQHYFKDLMNWFTQDNLQSVGLKDLRQR